MTQSQYAAVVLAAGAGTRLRPLTVLRPKALCPVNNIPLVDYAIARAMPLATSVAVNVHHGRDLMEEHLAGRVHLSIEEPDVLGSAGALGALREWIAGRDVLVLNADAYHPQEIDDFAEGWNGERPRLLTVDAGQAADFGTRRYTGTALLPWKIVAKFEATPSGLYDKCFGPLAVRDELELVLSDSVFLDCGTPAGYHAANMHASGGRNVVAPGAIVEGDIERTVVWPDSRVGPGERLVDAIRADGLTVFAV
ncbi:MAG: NDP-sugar synthase [Actinomycetota bacterium]|nr:NTP transferase domain-containing protein [Actinomycetota bacterium]